MLYVKDKTTGKLATFAKGDTVNLSLLEGPNLVGKVLIAGESDVTRDSDGLLETEEDYLQFLAEPLLNESVTGLGFAIVQLTEGTSTDVGQLPSTARVVTKAGQINAGGEGLAAELLVGAVVRRAGEKNDEQLVYLFVLEQGE